MIVVSIIALLAMIALPSLLHAREESQNAKFVNALRVATGAFEMYNMEHSGFPPDSTRGVVPAGMDIYFGKTLRWSGSTPLGGNWDWDAGVFGVAAAVSVIDPTAPPEQFTVVDQKIDDGNVSTGRFRSIASDRYSDVLQ